MLPNCQSYVNETSVVAEILETGVVTGAAGE